MNNNLFHNNKGSDCPLKKLLIVHESLLVSAWEMYRKKYGEHVYLHWVNGLNYGLFFLFLFLFFFFIFVGFVFVLFLFICLFAHNGNCATVRVC